MKLPLVSAPDCTACDLHEFPVSVGVGTVHLDGSLAPGMGVPLTLFLGQNPGFEEDQRNEPFVGPSGRVLREAYVRGSGLDKVSAIYLANGVRCRTPQNMLPTRRQFRACMAHTRRDLHVLARVHPDPFIVVCLGAAATRAFFNDLVGRKGPISLTQGFGKAGTVQTILDPPLSVRFFAVYHPAFVLRDRKNISTVAAHMQLIVDCAMGRMPEPSEPTLIKPRNPHYP